MAVTSEIAVSVIFLMGVGAGVAFMLPFRTFVVNSFTRAVLVSLLALAPMCLGAAVVGWFVTWAGLDRQVVGLAFFSGIAVGAVWENLKGGRRSR